MHRRPLGDTLPLAAPSLHSRGWGAREEAAAGSHEGSGVYYIIIILLFYSIIIIILLIMCCIYYKPAGLLLIGGSRQGAEAPRLRGLHHRLVLLVPSAGCRARGGAGDGGGSGASAGGQRLPHSPENRPQTVPGIQSGEDDDRPPSVGWSAQPLRSALAPGGGGSLEGGISHPFHM